MIYCHVSMDEFAGQFPILDKLQKKGERSAFAICIIIVIYKTKKIKKYLNIKI